MLANSYSNLKEECADHYPADINSDGYDVAFSTGEQDSIDESSVSEVFYIDGDTDNPVNIDYNCDGTIDVTSSYQQDLNSDGTISTISDYNDFDRISFFFGENSQGGSSVSASISAQARNVYLAPVLEKSRGNGGLTLNRAQSVTSRNPIKSLQRVFSDRQPIADEFFANPQLVPHDQYHDSGTIPWFIKMLAFMKQFLERVLLLADFIGQKISASGSAMFF